MSIWAGGAWLGAPVNAIADLQWRTMPYLILPWAAKLALNARILDAVEDLIGPDLLIYTGTFFIKEAHSPTIAAWHQDSTYYGLEPQEAVTVWIALSEASEAAGCMEALSFRGEPRQLAHVARVVEHSVNRARRSSNLWTIAGRWRCPWRRGRSPCITGFVRTAPAPIVRIIAASGWGSIIFQRACARSAR
jgi:Phytanoyl-CoA dioxygenase (PhyH)